MKKFKICTEKTVEQVNKHSWHEHTAATKQCVPDIVNVDDYETKTIYRDQFYRVISDTELIRDEPIYWIENEFTYEDLKELMFNALLSDNRGIIDGICHSQYVNVQKMEDIKVSFHRRVRGIIRHLLMWITIIVTVVQRNKQVYA